MGVVEDIQKAYDEMEKAGLLDQRTIDRINGKPEYFVEPYKETEDEKRENFIKKMWATSPTIVPANGCICSLISDLDDFTETVRKASHSVDDFIDAMRYALGNYHTRGWHYRQMVHRRKQSHSSRSM